MLLSFFLFFVSQSRYGVNKEGYIIDETALENDMYNLLFIKAQKLGYANVTQAIHDAEFVKYKKKLNGKKC